MTANFTEPPEVTTFLEQILQDGGKANLAPEIKDKMLANMRENLKARVSSRIFEQLSDEALAQFEALASTCKDESEVQEFLAIHIPNISQIVAAAYTSFRAELVGGSANG